MASQEARLRTDHPPERSEDLLRALKLDVRRQVTDLFPGDYRSIFSGVGTELLQVRP